MNEILKLFGPFLASLVVLNSPFLYSILHCPSAALQDEEQFLNHHLDLSSTSLSTFAHVRAVTTAVDLSSVSCASRELSKTRRVVRVVSFFLLVVTTSFFYSTTKTRPEFKLASYPGESQFRTTTSEIVDRIQVDILKSAVEGYVTLVCCVK